MEKKIVGYIPKLLYKLYLFLQEKFDPRPEVTYEEQTSVEICKNLIKESDSRLTFAPRSLKRFIKNDNFGMFVVIHQRTLFLINHVYSYSVYIENSDLYTELLDLFDMELENRREVLEKEMRSNIQHSLEDILKKITENSPL